jgi:hypothetical protein
MLIQLFLFTLIFSHQSFDNWYPNPKETFTLFVLITFFFGNYHHINFFITFLFSLPGKKSFISRQKAVTMKNNLLCWWIQFPFLIFFISFFYGSLSAILSVNKIWTINAKLSITFFNPCHFPRFFFLCVYFSFFQWEQSMRAYFKPLNSSVKLELTDLKNQYCFGTLSWNFGEVFLGSLRECIYKIIHNLSLGAVCNL